MISEAQIDRLEEVAAKWEDRPERRCQFAMAGIYVDSGLLPVLEVPEGPRDWAKSSSVDIISPWVEASGYFDPVEGPPVAGDLLGFRLGHTLHHVAIMLRGGRMVHVMAHHGVKTAVCIPTPWAKRLEKIWRLR